jgi:hypothetical protein
MLESLQMKALAARGELSRSLDNNLTLFLGTFERRSRTGAKMPPKPVSSDELARLGKIRR